MYDETLINLYVCVCMCEKLKHFLSYWDNNWICFISLIRHQVSFEMWNRKTKELNPQDNISYGFFCWNLGERKTNIGRLPITNYTTIILQSYHDYHATRRSRLKQQQQQNKNNFELIITKNKNVVRYRLN